MGNTRIHSFEGTLKVGETITLEELKHAFRTEYCTLHLAPFGYLSEEADSSLAWFLGSAHSHSMASTSMVTDIFMTKCKNATIHTLDLDQNMFGLGVEESQITFIHENGKKDLMELDIVYLEENSRKQGLYKKEKNNWIKSDG